MHRILLLEDDTSLAEGLCYFLKKNSYETDAAKTVKAARELLAKKQYDLLLLDVTLPDGLGECEKSEKPGSGHFSYRLG